MNDQSNKEKELIAAFREGASQRRAKSLLSKPDGGSTEGVTVQNGVVTVRIDPKSQSMSKLGGATKVLGKSKFSIPKG